MELVPFIMRWEGSGRPGNLKSVENRTEIEMEKGFLEVFAVDQGLTTTEVRLELSEDLAIVVGAEKGLGQVLVPSAVALDGSPGLLRPCCTPLRWLREKPG